MILIIFNHIKLSLRSSVGSAGDISHDKENCDPQIISETPASKQPRLDESLSPSAFLEADDRGRHVSSSTYESSVSDMVRRYGCQRWL